MSIHTCQSHKGVITPVGADHAKSHMEIGQLNMSPVGNGTLLLLKSRFINASKRTCGFYQVNFQEHNEHPIYQQRAIFIYRQGRAEIS